MLTNVVNFYVIKLFYIKKIYINKLFFYKIKELLAQFQHVYDDLKDKHEIAIAEKYYYTAKRYTMMLIGKITISIFL